MGDSPRAPPNLLTDTQIQYPSTHPSLPVDNTSSCPTRLLTCRPEPRHHRQAMLRREQHLLLYNNWKWTHCAMAAADCGACCMATYCPCMAVGEIAEAIGEDKSSACTTYALICMCVGP